MKPSKYQDRLEFRQQNGIFQLYIIGKVIQIDFCHINRTVARGFFNKLSRNTFAFQHSRESMPCHIGGSFLLNAYPLCHSLHAVIDQAHQEDEWWDFIGLGRII